MQTNYSTVTEIPGSKVSNEQLLRMCHRYHFAAQFCKGKDALEAACGAGIGLGYLAKFAKRVVGGDIDQNLLKYGRKHYQGRKNIEFQLFDAHRLPFKDRSFDVVLLYEAIYYLARPEKFVAEASRVLRENGLLIICTVNKDWLDFNPSPSSTRYFSASELFLLLNQKFSGIEIYGAFPTNTDSTKERIISLIKRTAIAFHLMPKTMKSKEFFKRIFFGKLQVLPAELCEKMGTYSPPIPISPSPNSSYKVLYAVAKIQ
ncbi:MAG: class I SAM-dependent methyltransferase [Candidatus Helarchaeota archaeon]